MAKQITEWLLRLGVAAVFLYAGVMKIRDTQQFALDVQNFQLTSWTVSIVVAVYLPWFEALTAIAILAKRLYSGALAGAAGMTIVFLGAILSAWQRGLDISCGCFGKAEKAVSYPEMIGRDVILLLAITGLWFLHRSRSRINPAPASGSAV